LQERLGEGGLLDTLMPAARRAKLWDLFEARFQELYREANDDFQSLFGEAFTKAYEEQIALDRARRRQT
jgi:FHA domain-containing protein